MDGRPVRPAPLAGRLWKRKTDGTRGYYHDARYKSLREVIDHYDSFMKLASLTPTSRIWCPEAFRGPFRAHMRAPAGEPTAPRRA